MKRLAVYDDLTKRLQAVDPANASGIPLPAFRFGLALPRVGSTQGEAFIDQNTGAGYVWTGAQWTPIAEPVVAPYPTETLLLAANSTDGTVALAQDTGNMFTRVGGNWLALGMRIYSTWAALTADSPADGQVGYAAAENEWAVRTGGVWHSLNEGIRAGTTAPVNPAEGWMWVNTGINPPVLQAYQNGAWEPVAFQPPVSRLAASLNPLFDGAETTFALTDAASGRPLQPASTLDIVVVLNGATLKPGDDYTLNPQHELVLTTAPPTGADMFIVSLVRAGGIVVLSQDSEPQNPEIGALWFDTDEKPYGEGIRIFEDGRWKVAPVYDLGEVNSGLSVPGYSGRPDKTNAPDGQGLLALQYSGKRQQLVAQTGAGDWEHLTPMPGATANHGHVVIGNVDGNPSWGGKTWFEISRDIRETIDSGYGLTANLRGYESVRIELQYVGQSLGLWPDANHSAVWIANRIKQDGTGNRFKEAWGNGAKWALGRGHGGCTFTVCKDPGRPNHFLFWCHGYHTNQNDEDANNADGDCWSWSGRGTWEWNGTSGNPQFRFTSAGGQHGRLFATIYGQTE